MRKIGRVIRLSTPIQRVSLDEYDGVLRDTSGTQWCFSVSEARRRIPTLSNDIWVTFGGNHHATTNLDVANDLTEIAKETDPKLLQRSFFDPDPTLWRQVVSSYFKVLDDASIVDMAKRKLMQVKHVDDRLHILQHIPLQSHLVPGALALRELLSARPRFELCRRIQQIAKPAIPEWLVREMQDLASLITPEPTSTRPASPPKSQSQPRIEKQTIRIAQTEATRPDDTERIQREGQDADRRRSWQRAVDACLSSNSRAQTCWPASEIYTRLTLEDRKLARLWGYRDPNDPGKDARMLSARAAERAAQMFYSSLSCKVKDVAITQLTADGEEWRTHDLLADDRPIDVKNARFPDYNRNFYVDHCVPVFKKARNVQGSEVVIAGVCSPYLELEEIDNPGKIRHDVQPITFLGETSHSRINELVRRYTREFLELSPTGPAIPSWLFEYPCEYYSESMQARTKLRQMIDMELPSLSDFRKWGLPILPAMAGASIALPDSWKVDLSSHQVELYNRLLSVERPTLPDVFLAVLTHFLEKVYDNDTEWFDPVLYELILFRTINGEVQARPLGLDDPLNMVWGLCDALKTLWNKVDRSKFRGFHRFHFQGLGLLSGTREGLDYKVRILAYCGGSTKNDGRCGFSPLVWGREETCPKCHYLICPKCHLCEAKCPEFPLRLARLSETDEKRGYRYPSEVMYEDDIPF